MKTPAISIIVPVYNAERTIGRCVESIKAQSFTDWELLLVDNNSKDNSWEEMQRLAQTDGRIRLLTENREGVSYARNNALDNAIGDYICFVDSDDKLEHDYLLSLYDFNKSDLTICGYVVDYVDVSGKNIRAEQKTLTILNYNLQSPKTKLVPLFEDGFMHFCWNKIFRRSIIETHNLRFEPFPVNEDYIFVMDYLKYADSISLVDKPLYHWIRNEGEITSVKSIPDNLADIYAKSHLLTRGFFQNNQVADSIAFRSYELIVYKYYEACKIGRITSHKMYRQLAELYRHPLYKAACKAYTPSTTFSYILHVLISRGCFRLHNFIVNDVISALK